METYQLQLHSVHEKYITGYLRIELLIETQYFQYASFSIKEIFHSSHSLGPCY